MILKRCGAVLSVVIPKAKRGQAAHAGARHGETDAAGAEAARMGTGAGRETRKGR